ncbi:MAG: serine hydrolase domain-containing protein [Bacteroidota bacterium]
MKRIILLILLFVAISSTSCKKDIAGAGDNQPPANYNSALATLLDSLRNAHNLPALAGAIVADTGVIGAEAVGCRRYGGPANVTVNDQFHLGSNTKAITAVLLGILVDSTLLGWDSTLPSIFPEYAETMRTEYRSITLRDILSHSAGFVRDPSLTLTTQTVRDQRAEVVAWALKQPPANARGQYLYSNLGYIIAGAIAEKLTNRPYEDLLMERVLKPLGITTAGFGPMGTVGLDDQPLQHTPQYVPLQPEAAADNPPIYNSAGRLHMSIGDWGRYIQWVLACEAGHPTLLRPETAHTLTTGVVPMPGEGSYAFGWVIVDRQWAGGRTLTHTGSNGLNFAVAWLAPNRRFAVLAETNICTSTTPGSMDAVISRMILFHLNGH